MYQKYVPYSSIMIFRNDEIILNCLTESVGALFMTYF